jgi:two-component SAPR family response regulator
LSTERGKGIRGRVLVIEADALVAEVLAFNIKNHGHDVAVAQTTDQAIQLAMKIEPNVLIVEPHLHTGIEGVELANTIVSIYPFAEVIFCNCLRLRCKASFSQETMQNHFKAVCSK